MTKIEIIQLEAKKRNLSGIAEFEFIQKCLNDESFYKQSCRQSGSDVYNEFFDIVNGFKSSKN